MGQYLPQTGRSLVQKRPLNDLPCIPGEVNKGRNLEW